MTDRPQTCEWETRDFRPATQTITYTYRTDAGLVPLPLAGYLVQTRTTILEGLHYSEPAPGQPPQEERPVRIHPAVLDPAGRLIDADDPQLGALDGVSRIIIDTKEN